MNTRTPGRTAALLSISLLSLSAALAGCDRRTTPDPQVPSTTTPSPTTPSTTPDPSTTSPSTGSSGTGAPGTGTSPDSSASSAMPPASAASQ